MAYDARMGIVFPSSWPRGVTRRGVHVGRCCAVAVALLAVAVVRGDEPAAPAAVVAWVDDEPILRREVDEVLRRLNAVPVGEPRQRLEATVLEQLVDERLLRAAVARLAIGVAEAEVDAGLERLAAQLARRGVEVNAFLVQTGRSMESLRGQIALEIALDKYVRPRVTPEALAAAYKSNGREIDGTRLRVSHILLRPELARGEAAVSERLAEAEEIRRDILQGRVTFEAAARAHSVGPSRLRGGDVGWIARDGPMVDAFGAEAFKLSRGTLSKPFVSPFGVHLAKVTEIAPGRARQDDLRPQLERLVSVRLVRELAAEQRSLAKLRYAAGVPHFAGPAGDEAAARPIVVEPDRSGDGKP